MRITWVRAMGNGEYRCFFMLADGGGRWADLRVSTYETRYVGGNAQSDDERSEMRALVTEMVFEGATCRA